LTLSVALPDMERFCVFRQTGVSTALPAKEGVT